MLRVVAWKWKPWGPPRNRVRYTADHVNRFASMVRRNLTLPHEIVCITDDSYGIDPSVRIVPMWDDFREYGMCYTRFRAFSDEMSDIIGDRFVSIDLDCVITNSLDPLFDVTDEFKIWENVGGGTTYCGSMFLMNAGVRRMVYTLFSESDLEFKKVSPTMKHRGDRFVHKKAYEAGHVIGSDQAWISHILGPNEPVWTRDDGVVSYADEAFGKTKLALRKGMACTTGCV